MSDKKLSASAKPFVFNPNASSFVPFGMPAAGVPVAQPFPAPAPQPPVTHAPRVLSLSKATAPAPAPQKAPEPAKVKPVEKAPVAEKVEQEDEELQEKLAEVGLADKQSEELAKLLEKSTVEEKRPAAATAASEEKKPLITSHLDLRGDEEEEEEDLLEDESAAAESAAPVIASNIRKHLNLVFIGHVDAGKSTISGHIMVLAGKVDARTLEKFERESKALGREGWHFAYVNDVTDEERAKGKTHECGLAQFETETRRYSILDAPGHKAFISSMIGGAAQADVGILVISARKGEFESGFDKEGQTREHAVLAKTSGIRNLIVAINKMDDPSVGWSQVRYDECVSKLLPFLKQVGFPQKDLVFLPMSGLTGHNLNKNVTPDVCSWYSGPCLFEILDTLPPPERLLDAPVRLPIVDKYKEMGALNVMGKLESGTFKKGDTLCIMPGKFEVKVSGIYFDTNELAVAEPGDNLRVKVTGVEEEQVHPGFVLSCIRNPIPVVTAFDGQVRILECKSIITAGYAPVLHLHTSVEECVFTKLIATVDKAGKILKPHPKFVKSGDTVIVTIETAQSVAAELYKTLDRMGRFMIRQEGKTVGIGVIKKLHDSKPAVAAAPAK